MKNYLNNKGYLLPMAIIFIVIAVIMGAGILYLGGMEQIGAKRRVNREKAFYIAEAGADWAFAYLNEGINKDGAVESLGDGEFSIVIEEDDNDRTNIISTGTVNGLSETIKLILASGGGGGNLWSQGLFGSKRIRMSNHAEVSGYDSTTDPYGNYPIEKTAKAGSLLLIEMSNNTKIDGVAAVTSEGDIILHNEAEITVEPYIEDNVFGEPLNQDPLPEVEIPSYMTDLSYPTKSDPRLIFTGDKDWYWELSNGNLNVWHNKAVLEITGGKYKFNNIYSSDGIVRFTGNSEIYVEQQINVSNSSQWDIQGNVVFYLGTNSNFFVSNNAKIGILDGKKIYPNLPESLIVYSASTRNDAVNFSNNSDIACLLYVPKGRVDLNNNVTFLGGIVADILDLSNNIRVYYDVSLQNKDLDDGYGGGSGGQLTRLRWVKE